VPAALVEIQRALELDPENPEAHYLMGVVKMGQGLEHLEIANRATCMKEAQAEAERADAEVKMTEAKQSFERALTFRAAYAEAYDGLAVLAINNQDFDAAVRFEQRAQESVVFAENRIARANLGWAYYRKKDLVRAEKELREAVAKEPRFCVGHYRLGQVLFDETELGQAIDELTMVASQKCPIQEAYRLLGLAKKRLHADAEAKQAFETCIQLAPHSCMAQECRQYAGLIETEEE
jgi:Flp pilus assembly protein TadD